jgi:glycosyltransferase involved in cell wall biosynthesis
MIMARYNPERPLRVMMVSEFPFNHVVVGGVQSAVQILVEALAKRDDIEEVLLLSFLPSLARDQIEQWNKKLTVHYAVGQKRFLLPTQSYWDFQKAKEVAHRFQPDIVHAQGTGGHGDVGVRLDYPNALTIHGVGSFEAELRERKNKIIGPVRIWLTRKMIARIMRNARLVISISEFDRLHCLSHGTERVVGVPNAVRYEFVQAKPEFPTTQRIVFNGVIIPRKNVVGLVRAFRKVKERVPDAFLDIVGPMTDPAYYAEVVKNIDPTIRTSVVFHGNKPVHELIEVMKNGSVSVLFSIYENLPVAIAEALMLGKPAVASRVGGLAEMVQDGLNGFLVESGDEDALANRLIGLLQDGALRRRMGLKARELAMQKWNPDAVAAETVKAYKLAIEGTRN